RTRVPTVPVPGSAARSLPSSERDAAVHARRGRSDHSGPRVTLEAGRIFHGAGVWGRRCHSHPPCPAHLPQTRLSLVSSASDSLVSRLVCLCLFCLCLVCLCFVCAGSLGRLCFLVPSGVEPHGRPRRGV